MSREVVALVSADDFVAAVRIYADRVHDLLRRSGCGPLEAMEVCESYALAMLDGLVNAPESVGDMAGWWFARTLEIGRRLGAPTAAAVGALSPGEAPASVLAGTSGEQQVRAALAGLPESERAAVVLRDAYDLPLEAVAVALQRSTDVAAGLVAAGRLHLVARYDDRHPPGLAGHTGRTVVDIATLGSLADGSLMPQRASALRRHVSSCRACDEVLDVLVKGRRLLAALPVLAVPEEAREPMLTRVAARAEAVLPTYEQVLALVEHDELDRPVVPVLAAVVLIVLALVLGIAAAALARHGKAAVDEGEPPATAAASIAPSFSISPTPSGTPSARRSSAAPRATRTVAPTVHATSASPTRTPSASSRPAATTSVGLAPARGPRGTTVVVTGSGFQPGASVTVAYSGALGGSGGSTVVDSGGGFTTEVTANGTLPGAHTVTATDTTGRSATATFTQTT